MTVASADSVGARTTPRLFGVHVELALAFSLLPVIRIWELTSDLNTAISTAALFAGSALLIWQLSKERRPDSTRGAQATAAILLTAAAWQLAWIDGNDFWFYRLALVAWGVAWLLLWWGWRGLRVGWRILTAFTLWALTCDGPWRWMRTAVQGGVDLAQAFTRATAQGSAAILHLCGVHATVAGSTVQIFGGTISVGLPCTSLPLTKLLLLLLVLAALLLRLPWRRAAGVAIAAIAIAFATSVLRVALLCYVSPNPQRYHYWHEPDSGGQWFTAAAMVLVAWLFARLLPKSEPGPAPEGTAAANAGRVIAIGGVVMLAAARFTTPPAPVANFPSVADAGYELHGDESETINLGPAGGGHPNEPAWIQRLTYSNAASHARFELTLAYIPQLLAGDLRPEPGNWAVDSSARFAGVRAPRRAVWVATIAPDGAAIATAGDWAKKVDAGQSDPRRWLQWIAHRRPLRDKRAFWAEAIWTGPADRQPSSPPAPFSRWIGLTPAQAGVAIH